MPSATASGLAGRARRCGRQRPGSASSASSGMSIAVCRYSCALRTSSAIMTACVTVHSGPCCILCKRRCGMTRPSGRPTSRPTSTSVRSLCVRHGVTSVSGSTIIISSSCRRCSARTWVVSLSCCDGLLSILETGVRWYVVGPGTLRAPDTRVTPPSSRHDRSDPRPSLGSQGAIDAVSQLHGSAPALVTALASPGAVAPDGNTPMTVVVKYVGDTFLDLSCEKQPAHPDKKDSLVPPEGPQREYLSVGRVESVAV